eukprot:1156988-Pelagomonas_calceolata.AAC.9
MTQLQANHALASFLSFFFLNFAIKGKPSEGDPRLFELIPVEGKSTFRQDLQEARGLSLLILGARGVASFL